MTPIERVAAAIRLRMCVTDEDLARAALLAFDTPEAISDEMVEAFNDAFDNPELPAETTHHRALKIGLAASIRAAAGEKA